MQPLRHRLHVDTPEPMATATDHHMAPLLRKLRSLTHLSPGTRICQAFTRLTPHKCRNYLAAAGYEDDLAVAT